MNKNLILDFFFKIPNFICGSQIKRKYLNAKKKLINYENWFAVIPLLIILKLNYPIQTHVDELKICRICQ